MGVIMCLREEGVSQQGMGERKKEWEGKGCTDGIVEGIRWARMRQADITTGFDH